MNQKIVTHSTLMILLFLALSTPLLCAQSSTAKEGDPAMVKKLQTIKLSKVEFKQIPLSEAIMGLHKQSRLNDPEKKGVNLILEGSSKADQPITLALENVTLADALRYLASLSGRTLDIQKNSVTFRKVAKKGSQ